MSLKIRRFCLCAAAQTAQPLRSVIPVRFTSPSVRLEVGQICWHWRPFPLLRQCYTHSRVSLASHLVLEPDPQKRVTLSCNVTRKLEQKGLFYTVPEWKYVPCSVKWVKIAPSYRSGVSMETMRKRNYVNNFTLLCLMRLNQKPVHLLKHILFLCM